MNVIWHFTTKNYIGFERYLMNVIWLSTTKNYCIIYQYKQDIIGGVIRTGNLLVLRAELFLSTCLNI
jgi:hypothetical protein